MATLGLPSTTSHGGSDSNISAEGAGAASSVMAGGAEGSVTGEPQRTRAALEHLQQKVLKVTEQIRVEQEARDDNVAEYLKLAHNADKQQASRIKQVFEKKNQKSAQTIAHLHKKLEHYHKKLKEIEQVSGEVTLKHRMIITRLTQNTFSVFVRTVVCRCRLMLLISQHLLKPTHHPVSHLILYRACPPHMSSYSSVP